jgi:aminomethyltransferase
MDVKKLTLNDIHVAAGAKMMPFAGYSMPVRYSSDMAEHKTVRKGVGIFDVSHMGEFLIEGPGALDLIQYVTSNDAAKLNEGQVQYTCMPNDKEGIIDDLLVYKFNDQKYMLVVNASNIEKDWNWINIHNTFGAITKNISDNISLFAVQGPEALSAINKITNLDLNTMKYYTFKKGNIGNITDGAIISATGYTGAGGVEIYMYNEFAKDIWALILKEGKEFGIKPIGLGARDTLRLEMGYCLYGNDIDDTTSPIEAGLGWITKFTKRFVNDEFIKKQKEEGANRRLVGFIMIDKGIPRHSYEIFNENEERIGAVTSGTMSPSMGVGIGMGYVKSDYRNPGTQILIGIRNKRLKARIVKMPILNNQDMIL